MQTFSAKIVQKFMSAVDYSKFIENYIANRSSHPRRVAREVNDRDRAIFQEYRDGASIKELSKKYGTSVSTISTSIVKAAK